MSGPGCTGSPIIHHQQQTSRKNDTLVYVSPLQSCKSHFNKKSRRSSRATCRLDQLELIPAHAVTITLAAETMDRHLVKVPRASLQAEILPFHASGCVLSPAEKHSATGRSTTSTEDGKLRQSEAECHGGCVLCPPRPRTHGPLSRAEVLQGPGSGLQGVVVLALRQQR